MSFACPKCGKPTSVTDTRFRERADKMKTSYAIRRRCCLSKKCKHRFSTIEGTAPKTKRTGGGVAYMDPMESQVLKKAAELLAKFSKQLTDGLGLEP